MALLEEKLNVYEELSREMLAKLEVAVDKISESIQSISKITIRHEERIEKSLESSAAMLKLIDTVEEKRREDKHESDNKVKELEDKLDLSVKEIDKKIDEIYKFRYTAVGALIIISLIITVGSNILSNIPLTSFFSQTRIEEIRK
jgi:plasmid maintenance system antidote protein VapI